MGWPTRFMPAVRSKRRCREPWSGVRRPVCRVRIWNRASDDLTMWEMETQAAQAGVVGFQASRDWTTSDCSIFVSSIDVHVDVRIGEKIVDILWHCPGAVLVGDRR